MVKRLRSPVSKDSFSRSFQLAARVCTASLSASLRKPAIPVGKRLPERISPFNSRASVRSLRSMRPSVPASFSCSLGFCARWVRACRVANRWSPLGRLRPFASAAASSTCASGKMPACTSLALSWPALLPLPPGLSEVLASALASCCSLPASMVSLPCCPPFSGCSRSASVTTAPGSCVTHFLGGSSARSSPANFGSSIR